MEQVTRCFQTLSLEVIALNGKFRDELGLVNAASILEEIQRAEKEKLQLVSAAEVRGRYTVGGCPPSSNGPLTIMMS